MTGPAPAHAGDELSRSAVLHADVRDIAKPLHEVGFFCRELPGENLFVVRGGKIYTPPVGSSILAGITRDTVLTLASDLGIDIVEQILPREFLYFADEVFMTGTAAEVTPVRAVDRKPVGTGKPGNVTRAVQQAFFGLFDGTTADTRGWLTPVRDNAKKQTTPTSTAAMEAA